MYYGPLAKIGSFLRGSARLASNVGHSGLLNIGLAGGLYGGAKLLDTYSRNNFSDSGQTLASVASPIMKFGAMVAAGRGLFGAVGSADRIFSGRRSGRALKELFFGEAAGQSGFLGRHFTGGSRFMNFIDSMGPLSLGAKGAGFLMKHRPQPIGSAVDYAKAGWGGLRGLAAGRPATDMAATIGLIKRPFTFPAMVGLAAGGASAVMSRRESNSDPLSPGSWRFNGRHAMIDGYLNPEYFGGGAMLNKSAVMGPNVMAGQRAVTSRMVSQRRF